MSTLARLLTFAILLALLPAAGAQTLELRQAEFVLDDAPRPPGEAAPWRPQALPDYWRENHPGAGNYGWYRFRFAAPPGRDPLQAIYLPRLGLNAAVWLNGTYVGDGGRFEEPIARNWNRPLLFLIPPGLLRAGDNTLHVRLRSHPFTQADLYAVEIGPEKALRPRFEWTEFLNITINQTATLLIVATGVLMLSLWWRRRQDVAYGYFGLAALVWAAQSTNLYLRVPPVSTATWEILVNGTVQLFSGFLLISLLRYAAAGGRPVIAALWLSIIAGPASLVLVPTQHFFKATSFWHLYTLVAASATLALLVRAALVQRNRDAGMLVASLATVVILAAHDWLLHSQHMFDFGPLWLNSNLYLLHYSAPVVFLSIGVVMTSRFVLVLNQFESLNNDLEERVRAKQAELQAGFARMRELETERAISGERERIYQDLHDDVGAKLLSLVYRAATSDDANLARSALQDLREVVSRTGSDSYTLEALAADWRVECGQRLAEAGIGSDWRLSGPLAETELSQPQALNLGRILREAVSNVIRHAGACNVEFGLALADGHLRVSVRDDGIGCDDSRLRAGRGLLNMETRAGKLGGRLVRRNAETGGCEIALELPLPGRPGGEKALSNPIGP